MSVTLDEMRTTVTDSVLHVGNQSYGSDKLDRAIRWAGNRFLKETGIDRTVGTVSISQNDTSVDIPATLTDFLPGRLTHPIWIGSEDERLVTVDFTEVLRWRNRTSATGTPEAIAFTSPSNGELFPTADQAYTLSVAYWRPLTSFAVGTANPGGVTLNIPTGYVDDVAVGAAAYLIRGAPGHPDSEAKMAAFFRAIESAKGEAVALGVWFMDNDGDLGSTYVRTGPI